jgi:hypothetical protein
MANGAGINTTFLKEALAGSHNIDTGGNSLKAALYLSSGSVTYTNTSYTTTSEVTGSNYTAAGVAVTTGAGCLNSSSKTAYWTPTANFTWGTLTCTATAFDAVMVYNTTVSSRNILVQTFASQSVNAANFTLTMPANDATNALMRITGP